MTLQTKIFKLFFLVGQITTIFPFTFKHGKFEKSKKQQIYTIFIYFIVLIYGIYNFQINYHDYFEFYNRITITFTIFIISWLQIVLLIIILTYDKIYGTTKVITIANEFRIFYEKHVKENDFFLLKRILLFILFEITLYCLYIIQLNIYSIELEQHNITVFYYTLNIIHHYLVLWVLSTLFTLYFGLKIAENSLEVMKFDLINILHANIRFEKIEIERLSESFFSIISLVNRTIHHYRFIILLISSVSIFSFIRKSFVIVSYLIISYSIPFRNMKFKFIFIEFIISLILYAKLIVVVLRSLSILCSKIEEIREVLLNFNQVELSEEMRKAVS